MHSIVEVLNSQSLIQYSQKVFQLARHELDDVTNMSWIISCCAHTMKRFTHGIKHLKLGDLVSAFLVYGFSLLVNSTNLELAGEYYKLMSVIFSSEFSTRGVLEAKRKLKAALLERPETLQALKGVYKSHNIDSVFEDNLCEKDSDNHQTEDMPDYEAEFAEAFEFELNETVTAAGDLKSSSIKHNSPFTAYFNNILDAALEEIEQEAVEDDALVNQLFNKSAMQHLADNFMPYSFIWAGFTLAGTNLTRLTNGLLENHNGFVKKNAPKNSAPHKYVINNFSTVSGLCEEYLSQINEQRGPKKRQVVCTPNDNSFYT